MPEKPKTDSRSSTIWKNEPVDLLLLDIKMPQMNGIETARYIKEHFSLLYICSFLSGYNDFEYARTAIRYGVK